MDGGGDEISDERIAEACLRGVMEEELREGHLDVEAPALPPGPEPQSEAERDLMDELGRRVRQQSSILKGNQELQDSIDGVIRMPGSMMDKFSQLAGKVFKNGVTWDKIILLFYVAGRMAIKVMEDNLPLLVIEIFKIALNYFKEKLLGWVGSHGGWSNSLSELSGRMQGMPLTTKQTLIIIAGLAFLSIVAWKRTRRA
ncbi:apoptosis regulator BAX-like [Gadus chalcogrammus]|uniref:apoptosis regulator BAX-like n=1 Tax=Gadus chalcogrammus TaxID=1042646 RepID=UPI0024C3AFB0|nr:apoptosis regulator BAX-like [Gadus chalcogrammus]